MRISPEERSRRSARIKASHPKGWRRKGDPAPPRYDHEFRKLLRRWRKGKEEIR